MVEQGHESQQQQETYHISLFPEDDEILVKKAEMESCKELLMRVVKKIRSDPERIPSNLRHTDRKKIRAATVKVNKIVSLIKTKAITKTNSVLRADGNIVAEMVGNRKGDDRKQATKLTKKNFREAGGITQRVWTVKHNKVKVIAK